MQCFCDNTTEFMGFVPVYECKVSLDKCQGFIILLLFKR